MDHYAASQIPFDSLAKSEDYYKTNSLCKTIGPLVLRPLVNHYLRAHKISLEQLLLNHFPIDNSDWKFNYVEDMKRTCSLEDCDITKLNMLLLVFPLDEVDKINLKELKITRNKIDHKPSAEIDDDKQFASIASLLIEWAKYIDARADTAIAREIEIRITRLKSRTIVVNYNPKLKQRLTKGEKYVTDVFFPVFILGNRKKMCVEVSEKLDIGFALTSTKLILDFDSSTDLLKKTENGNSIYTIKTAENLCNKSKVNDILTGNPTWIYCNGYEKSSDDKEMTALPFLDWRNKRANGVRNALAEVKKKYSKMCKIIFMVFEDIPGKDPINFTLSHVVDALDYPNGLDCVVISETESNIRILKERVRESLTLEQLQDLFVTDMSWDCVSHEMKTMFRVNPDIECVLPTSNGSKVTMTKKERSVYTDIEIISGEECIHDVDRMKDKIEKETQTNFYRGKSIEWWNYYFEGQVLERSVFGNYCSDILQIINKRAKPVQQFTIPHYPGAGGTTLGRHIMWRFSQFSGHLNGPAGAYRCCIVKKITEKTLEQVNDFRLFKERDVSKPVIILFDDEQDETFTGFFEDLSETSSSVKNHGIIFLVLRVKRVPTNTREQFKRLLTAKLTSDEQIKFKLKYKQLEQEHDTKYVNSLIAFNCLKESYNEDVLRTTVERYMVAVKPDERKVLKCLSVIGTYEQKRHTVPLRVFDVLVNNPDSEDPWYTCMSEAMDLLTNADNGICIVSQPLAEAVLDNCTKVDRVMLESMVKNLLELVNMNVNKEKGSYITEKIQSIVGDLFKRQDNTFYIDDDIKPISKAARRKAHDKQFSALIEALRNQRPYETTDVAHSRVLELLVKCFELTDDPMVGQQLARFLYDIGRYQQAESVIQKCIELSPYSSFLYDTYGLIFRSHMESLIETHGKKSETKITDDNAAKIIRMAFKAIEKFREGQQKAVKEHPRTFKRNTSCHFNEIRTAVKLLESFSTYDCYKGEDTLLEFLNDPNFQWNKSPFEKLIESCPEVLELRQGTVFQTCLKNTLQYTRDRSSQIKFYKVNSDAGNLILTFSEQLERFYGEDSCTGQCHFTCPIDLKAMMDGIRSGKITDRLQTRIGEAERNLQTGIHANYDRDLIVFLGYTVVCLSDRTMNVSEEQYRDLLCYSSDLIEGQLEIVGARLLLEIFLYHALFHWPTASRVTKKTEEFCPPERFKMYLVKWRKTYHKNHELNTREQREKNIPKNIFVFGKETPGNEITGMKYINKQMKEKKSDEPLPSGDDLWDHSVTKDICEIFEGIVNGDGTALHHEVEYPRHGKQTLDIGLYKHRPDLSNRNVTFFLGFNWRGPTALGVREQDEVTSLDLSSNWKSHPSHPSSSKKLSPRSSPQKLTKTQIEQTPKVPVDTVTITEPSKQAVVNANTKIFASEGPIVVEDADQSQKIARSLIDDPPNYLVIVHICRNIDEGKKQLCMLMLHVPTEQRKETYVYLFTEGKLNLMKDGGLDQILRLNESVWFDIQSASVCLVEDCDVFVDKIWDIKVMLKHVMKVSSDDEELQALDLRQIDIWNSRNVQYDKDLACGRPDQSLLQQCLRYAVFLDRLYNTCKRKIDEKVRSSELWREIRTETFEMAQPVEIKEKIQHLKKREKKQRQKKAKEETADETQQQKQPEQQQQTKQPKSKSGKGKKKK